jgi:hypothetical protein
MDPRDLVKVWDAPDNSRLTPKQWSIRLPIQVAAQINALCALYPRKTKTDIIGDLLATALAQLAEALPGEARQVPTTGTGQPTTAAGGLRERFDTLTRYYLSELAGDQNDQ